MKVVVIPQVLLMVDQAEGGGGVGYNSGPVVTSIGDTNRLNYGGNGDTSSGLAGNGGTKLEVVVGGVVQE